MQHLRDVQQDISLLVDILVFMSSWNSVLSWVEHEKGFITWRPELSGSVGRGLDWGTVDWDVKNQNTHKKIYKHNF